MNKVLRMDVAILIGPARMWSNDCARAAQPCLRKLYSGLTEIVQRQRSADGSAFGFPQETSD